MPRTLRDAVRRYRKLTVGLWALALGAWAACIAADALNWTEHSITDFRSLALACTVGALNSLIVARLDGVNARLDQAHRAMAELYRKRPDPVVTPQPWRALHSVGGGDEPALRNGHGATPRSSGA